jgi:hypothetical protein
MARDVGPSPNNASLAQTSAIPQRPIYPLGATAGRYESP